MANTISPIQTNVPQPIFTDTGFIAPLETAILAGIQADMQAAFGGRLNFTTTVNGITNATPQGQLANSQAAILGNQNDSFVKITNMIDPAFASGRMQDAIGRIYFIDRVPSQPTTIQVLCTGIGGTVIPFGAKVSDTGGNIYAATAAGTIDVVSGFVTMTFANTKPGPIPIPLGVKIFSGLAGWDLATFVSGLLGQNVETRSDFENRRSLSTAKNSMGMLNSIQGAVLSLQGVIDCFTFSNDSSVPLAVGGIVMPPNSLYIGVAGGSAPDIAQTIWSKKMPGCNYYPGNVTIQIQDTNPGYQPPFPTYQVTYTIPTNLQILMQVNMFTNQFVPNDAALQIQNAILNAFSGGDGLPRAAMASELLASRYYEPVLAIGNWAKIMSIKIGSLNTPDALFSGSIFGNTLTVASMFTGTIAIGQTLFDNNGNIIPGTTITGFTGGTGGVGTYQISDTQTVTIELMYGVTASLFGILPNFNQIPATLAQLINVAMVNG